ncbi:MAG TPA: hypothetical protein VKA43_13855 [Gammaproteobacteria bacterium]|nr:hypothetical protein [Gammaproteobacteria bacterium]
MRRRFTASIGRLVPAAAGFTLVALAALAPAQPDGAGDEAVRPAPRWADGTISFTGPPGEVGNWAGPPGTSLANNVFEEALEPSELNLPTNLSVAEVPFQPWARALYDYRQGTFTKDDPHTRCKPSGGARLFHTPYGFEILQLPDTQEIMFLSVGSPHSWRVVHMDGRPLPKNPQPSWYGTSVGHYEGDTLVIETVGFNERFWVSREGVPHTSQLRTIERISRPDFLRLRYEITIDDPGAYTEPWTGGWFIPWDAGNEPFDYLCQENNLDAERMVGPQE